MTKTVAEMEELLVSLKIPVGRIQNIKEACEHPQLKERNMLWTVHQPGMDADFTMPGTPIKIHGEPDELIKPAPLLGEDNDAILGELGYSAEQIARFKADGAV